MNLGWSKPRVSPIAVDFGADSLKLLQIVPSDPPQLVAAAAAEMPAEARTDPGVRHSFITDSLRQLTRAHPFKGRRVICSIPAFQTLVQHLQIARVEHEDFEAQIGLQLRQRLNIDPARMVMRHVPVAQVVRDGSVRQEVLCVAASRDSVMRHVEAAHRAKLEVVGMQDETVAILRAFGHLYRRQGDEQRTTCFIDLGAATTKVIIAHGVDMVFAKTIHAAGDHLTRQRAAAQRVSFTEARAARMAEVRQPTAGGNPGGPPREPEPEAIAVEVPQAQGFAILDAQIKAQAQPACPSERRVGPPPEERPLGDTPARGDDDCETIDMLIDELQLCVRYHQSLFPQRPIEKLVFLGGESRHVGTCQKVARALRIGAQLGDPLARLMRITSSNPAAGVDLRQPQPGWAVPLGLCYIGAQAQ